MRPTEPGLDSDAPPSTLRRDAVGQGGGSDNPPSARSDCRQLCADAQFIEFEGGSRSGGVGHVPVAVQPGGCVVRIHCRRMMGCCTAITATVPPYPGEPWEAVFCLRPGESRSTTPWHRRGHHGSAILQALRLGGTKRVRGILRPLVFRTLKAQHTPQITSEAKGRYIAALRQTQQCQTCGQEVSCATEKRMCMGIPMHAHMQDAHEHTWGTQTKAYDLGRESHSRTTSALAYRTVPYHTIARVCRS